MSISRNFPEESDFRPRSVAGTSNSLKIDRANATPRLLVSVRSVAEARIAMAGGADLIDVKEPRHGSLGFAGLETILTIAQAVSRSSQPPPPVSVALGELTDWNSSTPIPALPSAIAFAKVGLSGCRNRTEWAEKWIEVRKRFEARAGRAISWIAVHYVDAGAAGPSLHDVIGAAAETRCAGLLLDTFDKASGCLFEHLSSDALTECREITRREGLMLALAGRLSRDDVPRLADLAPDIIAVREAVCVGGDRAGVIDRRAIRELQVAMKKASRLA